MLPLFAARTIDDDPVCGLTKSEKLRVCASVLSASYLSDKIQTFNPDQNSFDGECKLKQVSFPSGRVKIEEDESSSYTEWMLPCEVKQIYSEAWFTYFISRAYHSHYAFVYARDYWTGGWYVENIVSKISLIIETSETNREESAPTLVDLLEVTVHSTRLSIDVNR